MIWPFALVLTFVAAVFVADKLLAAPKYVDGDSDHFDGKKFINPDDAETHHYFDVLKWWFSGNDKGVWHKMSDKSIARFPAPEATIPANEFRTTFVNHATFLLQIDGLNILTDPVWSDRASPYQWIGPKRMRPPGIAFEDLPHIDVVLLTTIITTIWILIPFMSCMKNMIRSLLSRWESSVFYITKVLLTPCTSTGGMIMLCGKIFR